MSWTCRVVGCSTIQDLLLYCLLLLWFWINYYFLRFPVLYWGYGEESVEKTYSILEKVDCSHALRSEIVSLPSRPKQRALYFILYMAVLMKTTNDEECSCVLPYKLFSFPTETKKYCERKRWKQST